MDDDDLVHGCGPKGLPGQGRSDDEEGAKRDGDEKEETTSRRV